MKFRLAVDDRVAEVESDRTAVRADQDSAAAVVRRTPRGYEVVVRRRRFVVRPSFGGAIVNGRWRRISTSDIQEELGPSVTGSAGRPFSEVRPPMPGHVVSVLVGPGESVRKGQPLLILEAMKMQNEVPAPVPGVVEAVRVREGDSVTLQDVLAVIRSS